MKKILSVLLVLCIFVSMFAVSGYSASAKEFDAYTKEFISKMSDDKTSYFTILMYDIYPEALMFVHWVNENNLLPDASMYTDEYAKELEAEYLQYVADERAKVLVKNQQFFDENFNAETDELIHNFDTRGMIVVKASKASVSKLEAMENVDVHNPTDNKSTFMSFAELNENAYKYPTEEFLESYELLYALEYYKENVDEDSEKLLYFSWGEHYMYYSLYNHYPEGVSSADEATPDYALVFCGSNMVSPAYSGGTFGDRYILQEYNIYYPYLLGFHIFVPETLTFLTLREAWDMQIDGIEDVFEDYGLGYIRGDADFDREINIKDATFIQKCLAGIESFEDKDYVSGFVEDGQKTEGRYVARVSDMNRDAEVNIKDVTAIQKYVVGIPYK